MSSTREVPLTQGYVALVDDADYERVVAVGSWQALRYAGGRLIYAVHSQWKGGRDGVSVGKIRLHRFILGAEPDQYVDHANGDGLDNRRFNLRLCNQSENMGNQRKTHGTSGYKGVSWYARKQRWQATIHTDGRTHHLGYFDSEEDAARAYDAAARGAFGSFARANL